MCFEPEMDEGLCCTSTGQYLTLFELCMCELACNARVTESHGVTERENRRKVSRVSARIAGTGTAPGSASFRTETERLGRLPSSPPSHHSRQHPD